MRRSIRLTGRKQIPKSSIQVDSNFLEERGILTLILQDNKHFSSYPPDAKVRLRLTENKFSETVEFGTVGKPSSTGALKNRSFSAPSCEIRIVSNSADSQGMLLGSSSPWTLRLSDDPQGDSARSGILQFLPKDISPQVWKLDIRDADHPVVYVDKTIPDHAVWVRTDPVFLGAVLPSIIKDVFGYILGNIDNRETPWVREWLAWADELSPGTEPPFNEDMERAREWIEGVADEFCARHSMLAKVRKRLSGEE